MLSGWSSFISSCDFSYENSESSEAYATLVCSHFTLRQANILFFILQRLFPSSFSLKKQNPLDTANFLVPSAHGKCSSEVDTYHFAFVSLQQIWGCNTMC